jgi:DNA (cytosine-5)-methyltransferase 1
MNENEILDSTYSNALSILNAKSDNNIPDFVKGEVNFMISKISSNKSLITALVTSFIKKIKYPKQDIRLHRTDFKNGYSARSLDTKFISPFFKRHFPKYANKESAFLTLSIREKIKWTKIKGKNLKTRNKKLKDTFLTI